MGFGPGPAVGLWCGALVPGWDAATQMAGPVCLGLPALWDKTAGPGVSKVRTACWEVGAPLSLPLSAPYFSILLTSTLRTHQSDPVRLNCGRAKLLKPLKQAMPPTDKP